MSAFRLRRGALRRVIVAGVWGAAALVSGCTSLDGHYYPARNSGEFPYEVSRYSMNFNRFRYVVMPADANRYYLLHGPRKRAREVANIGVTAGSHLRLVNGSGHRMRFSAVEDHGHTIFGFGKSWVEIPIGGSTDLRVQPRASGGATSTIEVEIAKETNGQWTRLEYSPQTLDPNSSPDPIGDPKLKVKGG